MLFLPISTCSQKVFEISHFCTIYHSVKIRDVTVYPPHKNLVPEIKGLPGFRRGEGTSPSDQLLSPKWLLVLCDYSIIPCSTEWWSF